MCSHRISEAVPSWESIRSFERNLGCFCSVGAKLRTLPSSSTVHSTSSLSTGKQRLHKLTSPPSPPHPKSNAGSKEGNKGWPRWAGLGSPPYETKGTQSRLPWMRKEGPIGIPNNVTARENVTRPHGRARAGWPASSGSLKLKANGMESFPRIEHGCVSLDLTGVDLRCTKNLPVSVEQSNMA